jgi:hypothetical protein
MRTVLGNTEELTSLRDWVPDTDFDPDVLQTFISGSTGWAYPGLANTMPPDSLGDLKSTLEQLFQNYTISLLTEPYLQLALPWL